MQPSPGPADDRSTSNAVLFLSGDLMFASRVRSAAERAGYEFQLAGQLPSKESVDELDLAIRFVILDLSTRSSLIEGFADRCQGVCPSATLIAYGPHVQSGRLDAARGAGIPTVMTRGQFDRQLPTLFPAI